MRTATPPHLRTICEIDKALTKGGVSDIDALNPESSSGHRFMGERAPVAVSTASAAAAATIEEAYGGAGLGDGHWKFVARPHSP